MKSKRTAIAALLPAAAAVLAAALSAGAAPGAPDAALPAGPNPACPDEGEAAEQAALRFRDVADDNAHAANIGCIAYYGITLGAGNGGLFAPGRRVTRLQMAFFMTRAVSLSGIAVNEPPGQGFDDIAGKSAAARTAVNTAAYLGLMPGTSATTFSPDQPVTRSDMALFLLRLLELTTLDSPVRVAVEPITGSVTITRDGRPVPIDDSFNDVIDVVTAAEQWAINAMYELGVADGREDGAYDPYGAVTRGQMASFIIRALGHTGVQPDGAITLEPPSEEPPPPEATPPAEPPAEPPVEPPAEEPPPAGPEGPLPPDPNGVYTGDPLQLIAHARFGRSYSLPGSGGDRWDVWICNTPAGNGSGPAGYASRFAGQMRPWFDWVSGGQYRPVFDAGGSVAVGPSTDYYQSCRYAVYDRYRSDQTEADGVVIIVFDPTDDSGLLGMAGFGCGPASDRGFPGNGRAVLINSAAVEDSTVLAHEIGHALCWPHSYSGETYEYGRVWEYDNPMDIMGWSGGSGARPVPTLGTAAVNRYAAGWIPPSRTEVHNPGATARYTLSPIGGRETQLLVVLLEEGDRLRYWALGVRTRGGGGLDWADRGIPKEGVEITQIDQSLFGCGRPYFGYCSGLERRTSPVFDNNEGYEPGRVAHVMEDPGDGWTYGGETGLSINLVSRSGGDFVVEVRSKREPAPPPPEPEPEPDPEPPSALEPGAPPDTVSLTDAAAGFGFTCGIRAGGVLTCWGNDEHGRLEAPAGQFTALAAGSRHACAIRTDGLVECWGGNEHGQADAPSGQFTAAAAGIGHTCGIRTGSRAVCWGDGGQGQTDAPDGEFVALAAGGYHTCGIRPDRTAVCWGDGGQGQTDAPDGEFVVLAAGGYHTCGIRSDRRAVCWGRGFEGQAEAPDGEFVALAAGGYHTCGIRSDRTAVCWGSGEDGAAEALPGAFTAVSAGWRHTCGIRPDRSVECWGDGEHGGSEAPTRFTAVSAGDFHSCGLRLTGAVTCWGGNGDGQSDAPDGGFTQVSAGWRHTCGVRPDRTAVCWGYNSEGQADAPSGAFTSVTAGVTHSCGISSYNRVVCWGKNESGESRPPFGFDFRAAAAGGGHTCGIRLSFYIECWGGGESGESRAPAGTFTDISAGDHHSCGVWRASGEVVCWGGNDYGQLDAPAGSFTKITSGQGHTCGLRPGGAVVCWGDNEHGQLDAPAGRFTDVSAGSFHACGLRSGGAVVCWGDNEHGQIDAPSWRSGG